MEFEKIASTLVPDKDWSVRIAAMQRVEGLVSGGYFLPNYLLLALLTNSIFNFSVLNVVLVFNVFMVEKGSVALSGQRDVWSIILRCSMPLWCMWITLSKLFFP